MRINFSKVHIMLHCILIWNVTSCANMLLKAKLVYITNFNPNVLILTTTFNTFNLLGIFLACVCHQWKWEEEVFSQMRTVGRQSSPEQLCSCKMYNQSLPNVYLLGRWGIAIINVCLSIRPIHTFCLNISSMHKLCLLGCLEAYWKGVSVLDKFYFCENGKNKLLEKGKKINSSMHRWRQVVCYPIMPPKAA